jgi:hypothetical protein
MTRFTAILEQHGILTTRRTPEERAKNHIIAIQRQIQQYIKDGYKGDLDLNRLPITTLPNNLKNVGNNLTLAYTPIASLPDNLNVGGNLYLYGTPITSLLGNLKVGGNLYLYDTPITSLPDNLNVGGNLYLYGTQIASLPDNLNIGGNLYLVNTPISKKYTTAQLKQLLPGVKGQIFT